MSLVKRESDMPSGEWGTRHVYYILLKNKTDKINISGFGDTPPFLEGDVNAWKMNKNVLFPENILAKTWKKYKFWHK